MKTKDKTKEKKKKRVVRTDDELCLATAATRSQCFIFWRSIPQFALRKPLLEMSSSVPTNQRTIFWLMVWPSLSNSS